MRKTLIGVLALIVALGLLAGAALAQGQGHGPPSHAQTPHAAGAISVLQGENTEHVDASGSYAAADVVDTVALGAGEWKVTATGAVTLTGDATALNCGLRVEDDVSATGYTMIGKQNPAVGGETGRVGFSVVGGLEVFDETVDVELVCYGGGNLPFEHNLVAVGG